MSIPQSHDKVVEKSSQLFGNTALVVEYAHVLCHSAKKPVRGSEHQTHHVYALLGFAPDRVPLIQEYVCCSSEHDWVAVAVAPVYLVINQKFGVYICVHES